MDASSLIDYLSVFTCSKMNKFFQYSFLSTFFIVFFITWPGSILPTRQDHSLQAWSEQVSTYLLNGMKPSRCEELCSSQIRNGRFLHSLEWFHRCGMTVANDDTFSSAPVQSTPAVMFRSIFRWTIATSLWWHEDVELVVSSRREWRRKIVDWFDRFKAMINFSTRVLRSTDQHEHHESNEP